MNNPLFEAISSEEKLYERFLREGVPDDLKGYSTMPGQVDFVISQNQTGYLYRGNSNFAALFAEGLAKAVQSAIRVAEG